MKKWQKICYVWKIGSKVVKYKKNESKKSLKLRKYLTKHLNLRKLSRKAVKIKEFICKKIF